MLWKEEDQIDIFEILDDAPDPYETVLAAIPAWQPTREIRSFGISAIQRIVKVSFLEAKEIRARLEREGLLPVGRY